MVEEGTAIRIRRALVDSEGQIIPIGGKTGTGDIRFRVFAPGGREEDAAGAGPVCSMTSPGWRIKLS